MKSCGNERRIEIKPLSVNKCWQGRRFKTVDYNNYEDDILWLLKGWKPKIYEKMEINLIFGFSSTLADLDNPIKPILDILQKRYKFNDKNVYKLEVEKEIVKKGEEFIDIIIKKRG